MYNKSKSTTIAKKDYSFRIAFYRLNKTEKEEVRKEICDLLHISKSSFNNKRLAYFNITSVEADIIREVFAKRGIKKVFNHEYIN